MREGGREISAVSPPKEHIVSGIALAMGFALLASAMSVYLVDVKRIRHNVLYIHVCVCIFQTGKLLMDPPKRGMHFAMDE